MVNKDLCFVVFTNQYNLPILKLFLKFFVKYNNTKNKLYIISNNVIENFNINDDKIIILNGSVSYDAHGRHFGDTMNQVLNDIKEKYIFFFCDDYMITENFNLETLDKLMFFLESENVDMFSFASHYSKSRNRPVYNINYDKYGLSNTEFYELNHDNYMHAFSVQPCIWNKSSLTKLFVDNPKISLHDLDRSILDKKENYKILGTNFYMNDVGYEPISYIFDYKEIVRHGVFNLNLNGLPSPHNNHVERFLVDLIKQENIIDNDEYKKYILFDKQKFKETYE